MCVERYDVAVRGRQGAVDAAIDRIFYAASSVQTFRDAAHRQAFRWLWLGRYLAQEPQHAFVALLDDEICGYLAGSLADPALRPEFSELDYFRQFSAQTARFPAHLHINVDEAVRSHGIGAALIEAFAAHARQHDVPGMHIVTGAGMRNVGFYERLGFREVARTVRNGGEVVMLACDLRANN
jgi:GNAT superfamily N-acetyltransferase